jgi:hydrogenase nickel incorporation protein HypA/HybF
MHELSIASAILDAVRSEAEKHPGAHVAKVCVRVGELSGVVPDALSFGFECLVQGTDLDPLTLVIESVPRRQHCPQCDATFDVTNGRRDSGGAGSSGLSPVWDSALRTLDSGLSLACPCCGHTETQLAGGDELDVAYLELESPESGVP